MKRRQSVNHLVSLKDLSVSQIQALLALAKRFKRDPSYLAGSLTGKSLGLIFQKPSMRTRVAFEVGMTQLGGSTVYLGPDEAQLGVREATKDIARVLSRYLDGIVARVFAHQEVEELAQEATIPVINGLSDWSHPCQALSDLFTIQERYGTVPSLTLAYVGDGNNILHSLLYGCSKLGIHLQIATPEGYEPQPEVVKAAKQFASASGAKIVLGRDPSAAVRACDVLYTDVWTSMGQEAEREARKRVFQPYQVNAALLEQAQKRPWVMHCLPAHRGEEITDDVIDGPRSIVIEQAANRLFMHQAILVTFLS